MKGVLRAVAIAAVLLSAITAVWGQQPAPTEPSAPSNPPAQKAPFELDHFYLVIMHPAKAYSENVSRRVLEAHNSYWQKIADQGDLMLAGPVTGGDTKLAEVAVYRAATPEDAKRVGEEDPAVQLGLWADEVHPWMTMKGALKPINRYVPTMSYYLGFLISGPNFSEEDSPERQKIQEGHMANIKRLGDLGKLMAAGPFEEDLPLRGIFVFRTNSIEEAQDLTNTDPAVQSGRLKIQMYQWKLPYDAFPSKK
jgi:uncharacterized protein YciI